tara:strand:+ start:1284 stop:1403 length:120 start_codon:yes stop_codon:yes gene_type:complete
MSFRLTLEVKCPSNWNQEYEDLLMAVLQREMDVKVEAIE